MKSLREITADSKGFQSVLKNRCCAYYLRDSNVLLSNSTYKKDSPAVDIRFLANDQDSYFPTKAGYYVRLKDIKLLLEACKMIESGSKKFLNSKKAVPAKKKSKIHYNTKKFKPNKAEGKAAVNEQDTDSDE